MATTSKADAGGNPRAGDVYEAAQAAQVAPEELVRRLTPQQRRELARLLAPTLVTGFTDLARTRVRRRLLAAFLAICCVVLAWWITVLASSLPDQHRAGAWRVAWTGFDLALFASLAISAWAAFRGRQILVLSAVVGSVLLACDAWFDVTMSWASDEMLSSILSAFVVELPLALLLAFVAFRVLRVTGAQLWRRAGNAGSAPPLHRLPLLGLAVDAATSLERARTPEEGLPASDG